MIDWKREALILADTGEYSWRQIALKVGVAKSTVSDFLRNNLAKHYPPVSKLVSGPKILFIDIETSPLIAQVWSMWQQGVSLNQIERDWFILSFSAKWAHSDEVIYDDLRGEVEREDDTKLLYQIWKLLDDADIVVGQNSRKFDIKKINARLILKGFNKPSPFRQVDTLEIAKRQFGFTSRKLEYMTDKLCQIKKRKHEKFPGHSLWVECLKDNIEAWEEMELYNKDDVLSLEELFWVFAPWDDRLPNFNLYYQNVGFDSDDWEELGYHYTNLGKYQRYRNKHTGAYRRGRTNLLTQAERAKLLANILV